MHGRKEAGLAFTELFSLHQNPLALTTGNETVVHWVIGGKNHPQDKPGNAKGPAHIEDSLQIDISLI